MSPWFSVLGSLYPPSGRIALAGVRGETSINSMPWVVVLAMGSLGSFFSGFLIWIKRGRYLGEILFASMRRSKRSSLSSPNIPNVAEGIEIEEFFGRKLSSVRPP